MYYPSTEKQSRGLTVYSSLLQSDVTNK